MQLPGDRRGDVLSAAVAEPVDAVAGRRRAYSPLEVYPVVADRFLQRVPLGVAVHEADVAPSVVASRYETADVVGVVQFPGVGAVVGGGLLGLPSGAILPQS